MRSVLACVVTYGPASALMCCDICLWQPAVEWAILRCGIGFTHATEHPKPKHVLRAAENLAAIGFTVVFMLSE